jgi:peptidoglycan/LPS O-acetylase OafA/YrhL
LNKQHHLELDLFKIAGALSIVLFHYTFRGYAADNMSTLHFSEVGAIFKYGFLANYLFFILSGFTILLNIQNKNFKTFISSRVLRLYPSFWVAVCLTTLATIFWGGSRYHVEPLQFLLNLTMLNGFIGIKSVDGAYWFVFVVLKFYLIIAMLILLKLVNYYKYFAGIWLLIAFVTEVYNIPKIGFFIIPNFAPFFISGMIFCSAKKEGWDIYKSIIIILSLLFSLYIISKGIPSFNKHYNTELSIFVVYLIIFFMHLSIFLVSINKIKFNLSSTFATLGVCTYPLYLIHQNIGFMLFNNYGHIANKYVVLIITLIFMFFLSLIIVKFIEPYLVNVMDNVIRIPERITKRFS